MTETWHTVCKTAKGSEKMDTKEMIKNYSKNSKNSPVIKCLVD
jgi:hypothetical protein